MKRLVVLLFGIAIFVSSSNAQSSEGEYYWKTRYYLQHDIRIGDTLDYNLLVSTKLNTSQDYFDFGTSEVTKVYTKIWVWINAGYYKGYFHYYITIGNKSKKILSFNFYWRDSRGNLIQ